jgi:hypothetical protein
MVDVDHKKSCVKQTNDEFCIENVPSW